ncbi:MAG: PqiC family protein [Desulfobacteraceae bacterium]|nr:PqiC family protein [Desulfobacteraceae bacterium]
MFIQMPAIAAAIFAILLLPGCTGFSQPPKPVESYVLSYPAPMTAADTRTTAPDAVLAVQAFDAAAPYQSRQMVYADHRLRRKTYAYHQWVSKPAEMIRDLIIRDLQAAQAVRSVTRAEKRLEPPTHVLWATIEAFYEDDTRSPWQAVLELTATLAETRSGQSGRCLIMTKTYQARQDLEQNNPLGQARAMSTALAEISEDLAADLRKALRR